MAGTAASRMRGGVAGNRRGMPGGLLLSAALLFLAACGSDRTADQNAPTPAGTSLVLYSSLSHARTLAVSSAYREETGVTVNFLIEPATELIASMAEKRHQPPADLLLISGTGALAAANESDVLRPARLPPLENLDPLAPMDPDYYWYGLGFSADAIVRAQTIPAGEVPGYADLAASDYQGRLCMRRGHSERYRSLVAAMLSALSPRDTELIVRGWRRNAMAIPIEGTASVAAALESGVCDVAILATDSVLEHGLLGAESPVSIELPRASDGGAVLHPTAAGVSRHAANPETAREFLQWLLSENGQRALHGESGEFPANTRVAPPPELEALRASLELQSATASAAFLYSDAILLIERAGYRQPVD